MEDNKSDNIYAWDRYGYFYAGNIAVSIPDYKEFGIKYNKVGDIIYVNLDLINYTLSYKINDIDIGVVYKDIKKADYRLAFTVAQGVGSQFELC